MVVKDKKVDASFESNKLIIGEVTAGKIIDVEARLFGQAIMDFKVKIGVEKLSGGFGTKDQPFLIADYKDLISLSEIEKGEIHVTLVNDIDLKGRAWTPSTSEFNGVLDGNNHMISNGTIICKGKNANVGLVSVNKGVIKDLIFKNIRCLNDKVIDASDEAEINIGIVAGENRGTISNIVIDSCAVRVTAKLDATSFINIGMLCGSDYGGEIEKVTVQRCHILGQTTDSDANGALFVGCVVGYKNGGTIISINSSNYSAQ